MAARDAPAQETIEFLAGGGELGARMRAHDWSASPLGPANSWPQPLKTLVEVMLAADQPMFVAWADERTLLYNDAYAPMLADRHPAALGRPFFSVWAEVRETLTPLFQQVFGGKPVHMEDIELYLDRPGLPREAHFAFGYTPVRDEAGRVAGLFCPCTETTKAVLGAKRREALFKLDEQLRDVANTADLSFKASEILGEALGAARVGYGAVDAVAGTIVVERNWYAPGFDDLAGVHHFADYGSYINDLRRGEAVANADVDADPRTVGNTGAFKALGIRAHLDVPVVEGGQLVGQMFVHSASQRVWTDEEVAFVRDFAERTRAAIARRKAEQELRESETRFRALATVGSSAVYRMSPDWREMRRLDGAGFMADTVAPTTGWVESYIPRDERQKVQESIDLAIEAGNVFELEHRVLRADGSVGWTFSRAIPLIDDDGEITEWFGAATDVTARVEADRSFTRLFAASPAPFLVVKPDAPRFTISEVNDAYLAATMRTRDDLVGRGIFNAFPGNPDDPSNAGVSRLRASLERVLATRQPDELPGLKYDIARPDGTFEERWWSPVNSPVLGEDGKVEALIHNANDVTEARLAEAALRESEARLRFALKAGRLGEWELNLTTGELTTSKTCRTNFGRDSSAPFTYEELRDAVHPEDKGRMTAAVERSVSTGEDYDIEYRVVTPMGEVRWVQIRAQPSHAPDGAPLRITGVSLDITERKWNEVRLRELNDTLEAQVLARSAERDRLWNLSQDMLARADYKGMMSAISPAWEKVLGWSEEELLRRGYATFMHPSDAPATLEAIRSMAETG
jgi:PAS domain-containing protein